ncbi:MAG: hypothetical protein J6V82_04505 [Clostridia bacterium]|nr:hypothetical protein [Bacteroidales bacterium]MBO5789531.1 hypothetical protein [Clostridia bacterium]MBO7150993.1 hypothetical protein [Clostridia bacterium]
MKGLRTQETNKFQKYFSIVQEAAEKKDCVFFLDAGDGRDFETETLEGEDLMGWLIPKNRVDEFEEEWEAGEVSDDWSGFYKWAIWSNPDNPTVKFE